MSNRMMYFPLLFSAAAYAVLLSASPVAAQTTGSLTCPKGKVEAKSFAAYYAPAKKALTVFFYKDEMNDDELDAQMAERAKFDAGANAKGPGTGVKAKYRQYVFKAWARVNVKPGTTVNAADFAKSAYYSYTCESGKERTVNHEIKGRADKVKAAFPAMSFELKPGGKATMTTKGTYDGDPKDKAPIKVDWNLQGTGKLRVYE